MSTWREDLNALNRVDRMIARALYSFLCFILMLTGILLIFGPMPWAPAAQ